MLVTTCSQQEMNMEYTLQEHGDYYEKKYWHILKDNFPNYEVFWKEFIVPLTKRNEGGGIGLRENLQFNWLYELAMAHYSVYYHLAVAEEFRRKFIKSEYEFSEHIFYHLSSATEMVERLLFILARLVSDFNGNDSIKQLSSADITTIVQDFLTKTYKNDFEKHKERGQAVNIRLHTIDNVIVDFIKNHMIDALATYKEWKNITRKIRHYRNTLAHNQKLVMYLVNNTLYVPKEEKLHKYSSWSSIISPKRIEDFTPLSDLLANYINSLTQKTNLLWTSLIEFVRKIKPGLQDYNLHLESFQNDNLLKNTKSLPSGTSSISAPVTSSSTVIETNIHETHTTTSGTLIWLQNPENDNTPTSE